MYDNWKIRLPEDSKDAIKLVVFKEYEPWIQQTIQDFDDIIKAKSDKIYSGLKLKYMEKYVNGLGEAEDLAEFAYTEYRGKIFRATYEAEDYPVVAKDLIRQHFKTEFGERFKVTLCQRIKDLAGDFTGIGEKPEYSSIGLPTNDVPASSTLEEEDRGWQLRWRDRNIAAKPVSFLMLLI